MKPEYDAYGQEILDFHTGKAVMEIIERDDGLVSASPNNPQDYFAAYPVSSLANGRQVLSRERASFLSRTSEGLASNSQASIRRKDYRLVLEGEMQAILEGRGRQVVQFIVSPVQPQYAAIIEKG